MEYLKKLITLKKLGGTTLTKSPSLIGELRCAIYVYFMTSPRALARVIVWNQGVCSINKTSKFSFVSEIHFAQYILRQQTYTIQSASWLKIKLSLYLCYIGKIVFFELIDLRQLFARLFQIIIFVVLRKAPKIMLKEEILQQLLSLHLDI